MKEKIRKITEGIQNKCASFPSRGSQTAQECMRKQDGGAGMEENPLLRVLESSPRIYMKQLYGENQKLRFPEPEDGETFSGDDRTKDFSTAVSCFNGRFVGSRAGDVVSYKGIPYAKPPVGELRWKAPVPVEEDHSGYEAKYFGKVPIQTELNSESSSFYPQSEDCLYLNIWRNVMDRSENKPVMVFIHGGSYGWGGTADPLYEGTRLVKNHPDILYVSIAYRIGMMGFIDLSSLKGGEDYPDSCNLGLLDQMEGLRWVQKNIAFFGGDPGNVTIFGESAGGGSVSLLPLMKGSQGLFRRVIAQSGSIALTFSRAECQLLTEKLKKMTGAEHIADLIAIPEREIRKLNKGLNDYTNFPMRDGRILPEDLYAAYENPALADLDFMIGTNQDETRYWINDLGYWNYRLMFPFLYRNQIARLTEEDR